MPVVGYLSGETALTGIKDSRSRKAALDFGGYVRRLHLLSTSLFLMVSKALL